MSELCKNLFINTNWKKKIIKISGYIFLFLSSDNNPPFFYATIKRLREMNDLTLEIAGKA